ncbi:hypothetical protein LMH73_024440, partial [Vibrio splendidus]
STRLSVKSSFSITECSSLAIGNLNASYQTSMGKVNVISHLLRKLIIIQRITCRINERAETKKPSECAELLVCVSILGRDTKLVR